MTPEGSAGAGQKRPAAAVLALPATERVRVNEIFYSLQGESTQVGRPCVMVRLTGCQMRCRWCDSEYSFYEGSWSSVVDVVERVQAYGCNLVELTGGEPLLQPGAIPLLEQLCNAGLEVMLETGGGVDISPVDPRVRRIVDVKCPGSGESENNHWTNLDALHAHDELKFVLADRADYEWARSVVEERDLSTRCPVHFAPVEGELDPVDLARWILDDRLCVRLAGQLHKRLWGERRGV